VDDVDEVVGRLQQVLPALPPFDLLTVWLAVGMGWPARRIAAELGEPREGVVATLQRMVALLDAAGSRP
jgi:hypothetical protein